MQDDKEVAYKDCRIRELELRCTRLSAEIASLKELLKSAEVDVRRLRLQLERPDAPVNYGALPMNGLKQNHDLEQELRKAVSEMCKARNERDEARRLFSNLATTVIAAAQTLGSVCGSLNSATRQP